MHTSADIEYFLPNSILQNHSGFDLSSNDIAVERRIVTPGEYPQLLLDRHFLVLWTNCVADGESAYKHGRYTAYRKYPNTLTSCHPGVRPAMRLRDPHHVVVASLASDLMSGAAEELNLPEGSEFPGLYGSSDSAIRTILLLLLAEADNAGGCGRLYSQSLATALATRLALAARMHHPSTKILTGVLPHRVLKRVVELMRTDLSADLDLSTLAAESGYSRAHFLRSFKAATGQTPHRFLVELRLQKARELLADPSHRLIDIAAVCGLSSHSHLTVAFRSKFGLNPSEYRRNLHL